MGLFDFLFNRWTILAIGFLLMFVGLKPDWTLAVVRMVGKMGWAESSVGTGGTFSIWKLIGILAPVAAIIYFFTPGLQVETSKQAKPTYQSNYSTNYYR